MYQPHLDRLRANIAVLGPKSVHSPVHPVQHESSGAAPGVQAFEIRCVMLQNTCSLRVLSNMVQAKLCSLFKVSIYRRSAADNAIRPFPCVLFVLSLLSVRDDVAKANAACMIAHILLVFGLCLQDNVKPILTERQSLNAPCQIWFQKSQYVKL